MNNLKADFEENLVSGKVCGALFEVDGDIYAEVAELLVEEMGWSGYYSGSVTVDRDDWCATLTVSMVIYRSTESSSDGVVIHPVVDIVPVWWEFSTVLSDYGEVLNDFSFAELRKTVLAMKP